MAGPRLTHIWRNWRKKPMPLYSPTLNPKDLRTIKDFITNKNETMENKFGYAEVSDTFGDLIEAAAQDGIVGEFGKKFELVRFLIKAAEEYPNIKEMVDDFGTFWKELKDLLPSESLAVISDLKERFQRPDPVQEKIIQVLENSALTQDYLQSKVITGAKDLIELWKQV